MCVLSIKGPIRKKSENLFNDPRNYVEIKGKIKNKKETPFKQGSPRGAVSNPLECDIEVSEYEH